MSQNFFRDMALPSFVYHLTLREASLVNRSCYGSFSGDKKHELALAKGSRLELLAVDEAGRVSSLCSVSASAGGLVSLSRCLTCARWRHLGGSAT